MRQRNNISRLPLEARGRVCALLLDGATYDEVRRDPAVARACREAGVAIHNSTFGAYREGAEYREYVAANRRWGDDIERRRMAAHIVESAGCADDLARVGTYELMRRTAELLEAGEAVDAATMRAAAQALGAYERNRLAERSRLDRLARDAEDASRQTRERELEDRIRELESRLAEATAAPGGKASLTPDQIAEIRRALGVGQ